MSRRGGAGRLPDPLALASAGPSLLWRVGLGRALSGPGFVLAGCGGGGSGAGCRGRGCRCRVRVSGAGPGCVVLGLVLGWGSGVVWVVGVAGVTGWFLGVWGVSGRVEGCFGPLGGVLGAGGPRFAWWPKACIVF